MVLAILVGAAVLQTLHYYPRLPSTVASHFGSGGHPDGWSSKEAFFGLYAALLVLLPVLFNGLPVFLRRIPPFWVNLPS